MKPFAPSKSVFDDLIAPHSAADFFAHHWQKSALLIKPNKPNRFQSLIPAAGIEAILAFASSLPGEAVELVGRPKAAGNPDKLSEFFTNGSTIRLRGIQQYHEPLRELCGEIEKQLGFPTRANLYCTPVAARGFELHFDTHEVLILQLCGAKHWEAYEPACKSLLKQMLPATAAGKTPQDQIDKAELGTQVIDGVLEPGDCLYLPSGFVHEATSLDEPSVHLTIGIHLPLESAAETPAENIGRDQPAAVSEAELEALADDTRLAVNGELKLYLSADGKMAALALGEKYLWLPISFAPIMRFVAEQKEFALSQLPAHLGEHGKLVFARELLEEGFLRIAG